MNNNEAAEAGTPALFLPNFCSVGSVFAVVVVGELLVFVLVLANPDAGKVWYFLGLMSLFVQWIGLGSAAALCLLRPLLARLSNIGAGLASYALILLITLLVSAAAAELVPADVGAPGGSFVLRSVGIAAIVAAVLLRYLYLQHERELRMEAGANARIEALQARIRPHFLFNSLNTIAATIAVDPERAERLVEDLADLFRVSLRRSNQMVTLAEELELVNSYLGMEQLRLGNRLDVRWQIKNVPNDALIPPLTLQPLLENGVYYGVEPRMEGGVITITGACEADRIHLWIENPPTGGSRPSRAGGMGMAQANVGERLQLAFGSRAQLRAGATEDGYRVELRFPYQRAGDEDTDR
ncbi:sensor histidine kinase [Ectothiorhodospiraceae bacterium WFHF3C12]|nr:sensor histidine kinase [Ectothiorhodospiraceae bacterium WFHF3C12]